MICARNVILGRYEAEVICGMNVLKCEACMPREFRTASQCDSSSEANSHHPDAISISSHRASITYTHECASQSICTPALPQRLTTPQYPTNTP